MQPRVRLERTLGRGEGDPDGDLAPDVGLIVVSGGGLALWCAGRLWPVDEGWPATLSGLGGTGPPVRLGVRRRVYGP